MRTAVPAPHPIPITAIDAFVGPKLSDPHKDILTDDVEITTLTVFFITTLTINNSKETPVFCLALC